MHFTVNLRSEQNLQDDFSYGLAFIPCPVWVKGTKQVLNLNPERPDFRLGSVAKLMAQEKIGKKWTGARMAHVIIHPVGHGSAADLVMLQRDLLAEGFTVGVSGQIDKNGPFSGKDK